MPGWWVREGRDVWRRRIWRSLWRWVQENELVQLGGGVGGRSEGLDHGPGSMKTMLAGIRGYWSSF